MRVLLTGIALPSHLVPLIAIRDELAKQGHEVAWWNPDDTDPYIDFERIDTIAVAPHEAPAMQRIASAYEGFFATRTFAQVVRDPALVTAVRRIDLDLLDDRVKITRAVLRAYRPDVVAVDGAAYARMVACYEEGVPFVGIDSGLHYLVPPDYVFRGYELEVDLVRDRTAALRARGYEPGFREWYCLSPHLNLVFSTAALVGHIPMPPQTRLVGPTILTARRRDEGTAMQFPAERLATDKPIVYAAFGTVLDDAALSRRIATAVARLGAQLVLAAGSAIDELHDLEGDTIVVRHAPQLDVLQRASAFINHGGAGSLMEAMYFGVPVLIIPMCTDAPFNAHVVHEAGAAAPGLVLTPEMTTVDALTQSIRTLLHGNVRNNAQRVAADYHLHDGGKEGAREIASLAEKARAKRASSAVP